MIYLNAAVSVVMVSHSLNTALRQYYAVLLEPQSSAGHLILLRAVKAVLR